MARYAATQWIFSISSARSTFGQRSPAAATSFASSSARAAHRRRWVAGAAARSVLIATKAAGNSQIQFTVTSVVAPYDKEGRQQKGRDSQRSNLTVSTVLMKSSVSWVTVPSYVPDSSTARTQGMNR